MFTTLLTVWCGPHAGLSHVSQLVLHGVYQHVHNSTHCLVWPPRWPVACLSAGSPWSLSTCSQLYSLSGVAPTLACGMSLSWFSMESINMFTTLLTVWCGPHAGLSHVSQLVLHGVYQHVHNSTHCLVWPPRWPVACLSAGSPWSLSTCSQLYSLSGVAPTLACRMSLSWFSMESINMFTTLLTVWCGPHAGLWHVSQLVLHGVYQHVHNSTHCLVWPPRWPVACLSAGSPWSLSTCSQLYSLSGVAPTLACGMSLSWFSMESINMFTTLLTVWCGPHAGLSHVSQLVLHALDSLVQVLDLGDNKTQ